MNKLYLKLRDSLLARRTRTRDLDEVGRVDVRKVGRVLGLADLRVRARARELNLRARAVLEVVEVLATAADEGPVLTNGDLNTENNAVLELRGDLLQLRLELGDELRLATQADLVRRLSLARAAHAQNISTTPHSNTLTQTRTI